MAVQKRKPAAKKVAVRKVAKKSAKKKPAAKKVTSRIKPVLTRFDSHLISSDVPIYESFKNVKDAIEKTSRGIPVTPSIAPAATKAAKKSGRTKYLVGAALLLVLGFGDYIVTNNPSSLFKMPINVAADTKIIAPTAAPTAAPVTTSFTYTSAGIRLAWNVKGIDVESIQIRAAENSQDFMDVKTLAGDARSLEFSKTDTGGWTKFQVTTTSADGQSFSSIVRLRGRFTI